MYRPEVVVARLAGGQAIEVACYNTVLGADSPLNESYLARWREIAAKVGLPEAYVAAVQMPTRAVAGFGDRITDVLGRALGGDLVGAYFVGSVALGGFVPGESDVDVVAVSEAALSGADKGRVAAAIVEASGTCPARGLEFTLYRREIAGSPPRGADFEVNVNGGPRMPVEVHLDAATEPGFWYVLDRAVAYSSGVVISGPPPREVFAAVPRSTILEAMQGSMAWHGAHEKATLYSVLNACRAWRFAEEDVLGSKLEGAAWARERWPDAGVIDAAVALRRGEAAVLDEAAVDALLEAVLQRLAR
jgi:hypothetical protein